MKSFLYQYYDTLPLHPQPIPMESFTSYLSRLAKANDMKKVADILSIAFPLNNYLRYRLKEGSLTLAESTIFSFDALPELACCSEEALLATTFFHLGRKLGSLPFSQVLVMFLGDSVAHYLRYCPACLAESRDPSYSLLWQFVLLPGCVHHGCRLLDYCGHCGQVLPLLSEKPTIAICSKCEGHLAKLTSHQLSDEEMQSVRRRTQDLEFLLTPYEKEDIENIKRRVGQQYAHLRRMRGLKVSEVASHLQVNSRMLQALEEGKKSGTLKNYFIYAEYLGLSFQDLYLSALSREDYSRIREDEWLMRAETAIETLKSAEAPITYRLVAQTMGFHTVAFRDFPRVKAFIGSFVREQIQNSKMLKFQKSRENVISKAKEAIEKLNELGEAITLQGIANVTQISSQTLRKYLRGTDLLKELMQIYYHDGTKRLKKRESDLFQKVQVALQKLETLKKPVRLQNICEMVGMTPSGLYRYPSVRSLLAETLQSPSRNLSRDEDLVAQVNKAIEKLLLNGELVGYRTVGEIVGVSPKALQQTLAVRELLETVRQDSLSLQKAEATILEEVFAAIEVLEAQNEPVGYFSVSKVTGISLNILHRSVQAKEIIQEAIEKQQKDFEAEKRVLNAIDTLLKNDSNIEYEQISQSAGVPRTTWWNIPNVKKRLEKLGIIAKYEEILLKRVQDAIRVIELRGELVTLDKILKTAHLAIKTIKGYPRIEELLEPYKKTYYNLLKQHSQQQEEKLVVQVQSIIRKMQVLGQPLTRRQVSEKVGLSPARLKQYPRVEAVLEQVTTDRLQRQSLKHQQREAELVKLLQDTIKEIEALGEPVTKKAVLQRITVSRTTIGSYPLVRTVWNRLSRKNPLG
jgi:transcriptional regulator with XRE-family HTH domain